MKTRAGTDRDKVELRSQISPVKLNGVISVVIETRNQRRSPPVESNISRTIGEISRTIVETSPVRRKRERTKNQDERMTLIAKALSGFNDDLNKLFQVSTWKTLIRKCKKGSPDERRFNTEDHAERLAKTIIEQIASHDYSSKVGQLLSAAPARRGKTTEDRATEFLLLADEYENAQITNTWNKATGEIIEDSSNASDENDPPSVGNSPEESRCDVLELEVEGEKENATLNKRQTRNSAKAQQFPLRIKSSQTLEPNRSSLLPFGKNKQFSSTSQTTNSISKEDFETRVDESFDDKPSQSPMFNYDEVIENDTPPPTPINGLEPEPNIPRKRTRLSSTSRDFERSPSFGRQPRHFARNDISFRCIEVDESPRSSRPAIENGVDKYNSFYCNSFGSSSTSAAVNSKDLDDLPDLEPPDTGRDKENLPKSEQEILRDYPRPLSGPELKPYMFEDIEDALSRPKKDKIVSAFGLTLMQEQLAVYNKSEWLEDANIDFYLEMIKNRNNRNGNDYPKVYIFQSYFYKLLDKRGYESVEGATGKDNIFEYDLVLIPIHSDHHWVLVVVNFMEKTMMCYDSMDHDNDKHLRIIAGYLKREWKERKLAKSAPSRDLSGLDINLIDGSEDESLGEGWIIKNLGAEEIPQQKNGRDCGVFCLQFAEYLSRKQGFDFEQKHTAYFRKRMLYETLKKTLLIF